jgi:hypothetical protein
MESSMTVTDQMVVVSLKKLEGLSLPGKTPPPIGIVSLHPEVNNPVTMMMRYNRCFKMRNTYEV